MKKVLFANDARKALKEGVDLCANAVKVSLGRNGKNVAIYNGTVTQIINDGVSIAKAINVKDDATQAGIQLAKQCAEKTDVDAGDGTTTTIVLLQALVNGLVHDFQTKDARLLREELKTAADKLFASIKPSEIKTKEEMYHLALTSSLDEEIAKILSDAFFEYGKETKVVFEESEERETTSEVVSGVQFSSRSASETILKSLVEDKVVLEGVEVLALDKIETIDPIAEKLDSMKDPKELVVIANQIERPVLLSMIGAPIKFYPITNQDINGFEDIIEYSKGKLKVVITRENTTIIGGKVSDEYIEAIKENANTHYEKDLAEQRVARLRSGVLSVKVGGDSPVERNETLLKLEDASNALKKAIVHGFVSGRGYALSEAADTLSDEGAEGIIKKAAKTPLELIKGEKDPDIIDSYQTVKSAFYNALSTATSILMVEAALIEEKEYED